MGHHRIDNQTPFACGLTTVADQEGSLRLVTVVRATFAITGSGELALAAEQLPVDFAGERWSEDPDDSSSKYEACIGWKKPATDVVLISHAWPRRARDNQVDVSFRLGPVKQIARVFGERVWFSALGSRRPTDALPLEVLPLTYRNAFGGWDRSGAEKALHDFDERNPAGKGYRRRGSVFEEGIRLPNIEHPEHLLRAWTDRPPIVGFGFTSPSWMPRRKCAGTYDATWEAERKPLLPKDFDPRFFNAAPPELTHAGRFRGGEIIEAINATRRGSFHSRLPAIPPPELSIHFAKKKQEDLHAELDTIIVNLDDGCLILEWRGAVKLAESIHEVCELRVRIGEGYRAPAVGAPHAELRRGAEPGR